MLLFGLHKFLYKKINDLVKLSVDIADYMVIYSIFFTHNYILKAFYSFAVVLIIIDI